MSTLATSLSLGHFLALGAVLFCIAVAGIFLNRKNVIVLLMCIELMLLAVNINFVAFSRQLGDSAGQDPGAGRAEEGQHQEQRRVHRVADADHRARGQHGQGGEGVEGKQGEIHAVLGDQGQR